MEVRTNSPMQSVPDDYCPAGSARWFQIPSGHNARKTVFYYDHVIGDGAPVSAVLFVHGNPECSYTYRHVCAELISSGAPLRLIALDHIGFGASDQATFEMVDMHHSANLRQLVEHLDLRQVTLVIHDWGGPIGVGAFDEGMDRVTSLVVLNSTIFPMPDDGITYANWPWSRLPWSELPSFVPDSVWGGAAGGVVVDTFPAPVPVLLAKSMLYQMRFAVRAFPRHSPLWVFSESLRSKANARSSKRNVLQTPVWGHGYTYSDPVLGEQDNHEYYRAMQASLPARWGPGGANIPVAGHFGDWDPCGKESVVRQWQEALPSMRERTYVYPGFGHFIEEYKGAEIAASILELNGLE